MMSESGYRIELKGVSFRASRFADRYVLKDINLVFEPGEFVGIVGMNGAGKSSLLRAIAGELSPIQGSLSVGGQPVLHPINRVIDGVGVVHQADDADLIEHMSVSQNICVRQLLGGGYDGGVFTNTKKWHRRIAGRLAEEANLKDFDVSASVERLSGGERQMLSVAIAIHLEHHRNPCRALLLDEHTARLDHVNADRVMQYTVEQARKTRATTLMVTHRYSDALKYAGRIVVINDGRVVRDGSAKDFDVDSLAQAVEQEPAH